MEIEMGTDRGEMMEFCRERLGMDGSTEVKAIYKTSDPL